MNQGYHHLRNLQCLYHPTLVHFPRPYTVPPRQGETQAFDDFVLDYMFYIMMAGYLDNCTISFADIKEQYKCLHCLNLGDQIVNYVKDDRSKQQGRHRYSAGMFINTVRVIIGIITTKNRSNSSIPKTPSMHTSTTTFQRGPSKHYTPRQGTISASTKLKQIKALSIPDKYDICCVKACLDHIQVPDNDEENHLLCAFAEAIYQLDQDLNKYTARPCLVCGKPGHSFQECPLVQNSPALRTAYGKFIAYFNRFAQLAKMNNMTLAEAANLPDR